jgi:hypothetical protein
MTATSDKEEEDVATSTNASNCFVLGFNPAQVTLQEIPKSLQEMVILVLSSSSSSCGKSVVNP